MNKVQLNKEQLVHFAETLGDEYVLEFRIENGEIEFEPVWRADDEMLDAFEREIHRMEIQYAIALAGKRLLIDKENFEIDGKKYFTWDEAMDIAKSQGKRLLTAGEYEELIKFPNKWDEEKSGWWFDELFFPAAGYRNLSGGGVNSEGAHGYYWSASGTGNSRLSMTFDSYEVYPLHSNNRAYGFSVRLVQDIDSL